MRLRFLWASGIVLIGTCSISATAYAAVPLNPIYALRNNGEVVQVSPAGAVTTVATGLPSPAAMKFDRDGNLYVACGSDKTGGATIQRITPNGQITTFAAGLTVPSGLAFDADDNLYVSLEQLNLIIKVTPQGFISPYSGVGGEPEGLAVDSHGNLFVATLTAKLYKITPDGTATLFANTGRTFGGGLTIDSDDNLYMSNLGGMIDRIKPDGTVSLFGVGTSIALGLAIDQQGLLYAADLDARAVRVFDKTGSMSTLVSELRYVTDVAVPIPEPSALWVVVVMTRFIISRHGRSLSGSPCDS